MALKKSIISFVSQALLSIGLFILLPIASNALEEGTEVVPETRFFAGVIVSIIGLFTVYRTKESIAGFLQGIGGSLFIPGAFVVLSQIAFTDFFSGGSQISGLLSLDAVAEPSALVGIAGLYLLGGALLYWTGSRLGKSFG